MLRLIDGAGKILCIGAGLVPLLAAFRPPFPVLLSIADQLLDAFFLRPGLIAAVECLHRRKCCFLCRCPRFLHSGPVGAPGRQDRHLIGIGYQRCAVLARNRVGVCLGLGRVSNGLGRSRHGKGAFYIHHRLPCAGRQGAQHHQQRNDRLHIHAPFQARIALIE